MTTVKKPDPVINSEKESVEDLYYCLHPDETEGTIRHYYELFPNLDEEVALLCYQATKGKPEDNENFIKEAQKFVDERNNKLLQNFGKNYVLNVKD